MLDPEFVDDSPYEREALLIDEILEVDAAQSRLLARMPTHAGLPLTALQRVHPVKHPRHVAAGGIVHATGMLGLAHGYYVLGLRYKDGWIGFGTNIKEARYGRLATVGPPLLLECRGLRTRRLRGGLYVSYGFRFTQEDEVVYESEQAAVWRRLEA